MGRLGSIWLVLGLVIGYCRDNNGRYADAFISKTLLAWFEDCPLNST